jgi:hypothetical protein
MIETAFYCMALTLESSRVLLYCVANVLRAIRCSCHERLTATRLSCRMMTLSPWSRHLTMLLGRYYLLGLGNAIPTFGSVY